MTIGVRFASLARRAFSRHLRRAAWLAALLAVAMSVGLGPLPAAAQTPPAIDALHISLWPEFDRPGVLVIIDGSLPAGTALPAEVSLRMPAAAERPNATAYQGADGNLLSAAYTTASAGSDIIVTFPIESLAFRLEYYDPALTVTGERRTYTFSWISDYAVAAATVRVQQPAGASALTTTPALAATGAADYGLEYYEGSLGALTAGQTVLVTASYTKADAALSSEVLGVAPAAPTAVETPASTNTTAVAGVVAGVGVLAAGAVGFIYWRGRRPTRAAQGHRRAAPRRHRSAPAVEAPRAAAVPRPSAPTARLASPPATGAAFCTQCGQRRQPGDKFCRQCGAPVRA